MIKRKSNLTRASQDPDQGVKQNVRFAGKTQIREFDLDLPSDRIENTSKTGKLKTDGGKRPRSKKHLFERYTPILPSRSPKPLLLPLPEEHAGDPFLRALFQGHPNKALKLLKDENKKVDFNIPINMHSKSKKKSASKKRSDFVWTPLKLAAYRGYTDIVKELLAKGAIERPNKQGWTALMLAARSGHPEIVETLLGAGIDPHKKNKQGWTALLFAACEGRLDVVNKLLDAGAMIDHGNYALSIAIFNGHLDVFRALLPRCSDINAAEKDNGWTPLMIATAENGIEAVQALLKAGADVNVKDLEGETALDIASFYAYIEVEAALLATRAQVQRHSVEGKQKKPGFFAKCFGLGKNRVVPHDSAGDSSKKDALTNKDKRPQNK